MLDPIASLKAPPPRYQLESDSSDEEGQGAYPASSAAAARRPAAPAAEVSLAGLPGAAKLTATSAVVAIGQAGAYLLRRASSASPALAVHVGPARKGTVFALGGDAALLALEDVDGDAAHALVDAVISAIGASSWTLVSSYVPAMYIPAAGERRALDPPVRYLSSAALNAPELRPYDAPNYVTGLAGAFLSAVGSAQELVRDEKLTRTPVGTPRVPVPRHAGRAAAAPAAAVDARAVRRVGRAGRRRARCCQGARQARVLDRGGRRALRRARHGRSAAP
ncbi:hypothetical protein VHUM_03701 [Vanrija humicola]|uniref:Uncharacterized protein n=1 Tax=Vanrija humicola TaxID=5417 RepID=A0A7D8UYU9_VANHU|nr:hypothetical protein VHUM_03701 [Vanrija humicola]